MIQSKVSVVLCYAIPRRHRRHMDISPFSSSTHRAVAATGGKLPFDYVMVVWGEKYVESLLKVTLPCLMAPRNLPALSNLEESRFLIITTPEDAAKIADAPIFSSLRDTIATQVLTPAWLGDGMPYHLKAARGHRMAAELAVENGAFCVYLAPDFILSDGALLHLEWLARQGKEAVMIPGIRLIRDSLLQDLAERNLLRPDGSISLSSRSLVDMALGHVHEEDQRYNWGHPCFANAPVVCTWNVQNEKGLLVRAFHLHPILVSMQGKRDLSSLDSNTIDGDFLGYNIRDWDKIHVEQDSDNVVMFSLTGKDERRAPLIPITASVERVGALAYGLSVNPLHRYFFTKAIKLHCAELNENWRDAEDRTAPLVYKILRQDRFLALQTFPISAILRHLASRMRQKPFRKWMQFLRRGFGAISNFRKRRRKVLRLELPEALVDELIDMQNRTGGKSLNDVIMDSIRHYHLELAQSWASKDVSDTADAGSAERISTSKRSDQGKPGEQPRRFASGVRTDAGYEQHGRS